MGAHHLGGVLSLLRQGLAVEVDYGTHSLEALVEVAETVEESVYEPHSLRRTPGGLAFALDNPPLRVGAFTSLVVRVNEVPVRPDRIRLRPALGAPWRSADAIGPDAPLALAPGDRTELVLTGEFGTASELTVRLELHAPAIPPRVWFEFRETPVEGAPGA